VEPAAGAYRRRIVDDELDELLPALAAIALEGAKGVGKTRTALQRARTVHHLDDAVQLAVAQADPDRLLRGDRPVLIDEWQHLPTVWDLVRRAVDDGAAPGSFLLTGSALPSRPPTHSGAGRIVRLRMRPLGLSERLATASVGLGELLAGGHPPIEGQTDVTLEQYVDEILRSGFPGLRALAARARRLQLDGYVDRVVDRDIPDEVGITIRDPAGLRRWMAAYGAASSTTATYEKIRDAASAGSADTPARATTQTYRDALTRVWMLDEIPAWTPSDNPLRELGHAPKHQLTDPALAAQLLGAQAPALLAGGGPDPTGHRHGTLLGALFESLAALTVRVAATAHEARIGHLRTGRGRHEIDLIVERPDGRVVAIEIKLARAIAEDDVRHLRWLDERLGDRLVDRIIITTGPEAYRRADGIAVVPLALLGH
jgi:predicted AAA+ superfamily ATPase